MIARLESATVLCLTLVSSTEGNVSLPELGVLAILGTRPPGRVVPPSPVGLSWEAVLQGG